MTGTVWSRRSRGPVLLALCVVSVAVVGCHGSPAKPREGAPPIAARLELPGVPNLGRASDTLLRGGQPTAEGLRRLSTLGVAIVVDLRASEREVAAERREVEALGMRFVSIPMSGVWTPRHAEVAEFLALLRHNPGRVVFVHCRRGAERTGIMVAAYRMAAQGWTPDQALDEMAAFRFRSVFYPHFVRYVRTFPEAYRGDPAFGRP